MSWQEFVHRTEWVNAIGISLHLTMEYCYFVYSLPIFHIQRAGRKFIQPYNILKLPCEKLTKRAICTPTVKGILRYRLIDYCSRWEIERIVHIHYLKGFFVIGIILEIKSINSKLFLFENNCLCAYIVRIWLASLKSRPWTTSILHSSDSLSEK